MNTSQNTLTDVQRLTVLKHLAGGKSLDIVATITKLDRDTVLDIGSKHGYPDTDKMSWAVDILAKKIDEAATSLPEHPDARRIAREQAPAPARPTTPPTTATPAKPDEFHVLINTAKGMSSKRIQSLANRLLDDTAKLRSLIDAEQEKAAAKERETRARREARAEVERLEKQLRDAKAKLRGTAQQPGGRVAAASGQLAEARTAAQAALLSNADLEPHGLTSKQLRAWAVEHDVDVPAAGRLPRRILDAWLARENAA